MPYLKISRDKRGYETYYLLEPASDRAKQSHPRILFWFRTPPQVKVGREPFSEEIRQAIESQNPDLKFDWPRLMAIQPPPLDVQRWRERRRFERAARQAAREAPKNCRLTMSTRPDTRSKPLSMRRRTHIRRTRVRPRAHPLNRPIRPVRRLMPMGLRRLPPGADDAGVEAVGMVPLRATVGRLSLHLQGLRLHPTRYNSAV